MEKLLSLPGKLLILIIISTIVMLSGCAKDPEMTPDTLPSNDDLRLKGSNMISDEEIASLMFMVEEEKLAMDVYVQLLELYGLQIFDKISQSELKHVDAISTLIEKYELENPIIDNPAGVFVNAEIQQLYDDLITMGSTSKKEAINVGILIEDKDILDIQAYLNDVIESKDIEQVYTHLLNGSEKHLESFLNELTQ